MSDQVLAGVDDKREQCFEKASRVTDWAIWIEDKRAWRANWKY